MCDCVLSLNAKELAQLLKRVDAEISNCDSCHHDEIEKRKKYKVSYRALLGFFGALRHLR